MCKSFSVLLTLTSVLVSCSLPLPPSGKEIFQYYFITELFYKIQCINGFYGCKHEAHFFCSNKINHYHYIFIYGSRNDITKQFAIYWIQYPFDIYFEGIVFVVKKNIQSNRSLLFSSGCCHWKSIMFLIAWLESEWTYRRIFYFSKFLLTALFSLYF